MVFSNRGRTQNIKPHYHPHSELRETLSILSPSGVGVGGILCLALAQVFGISRTHTSWWSLSDPEPRLVTVRGLRRKYNSLPLARFFGLDRESELSRDAPEH